MPSALKDALGQTASDSEDEWIDVSRTKDDNDTSTIINSEYRGRGRGRGRGHGRGHGRGRGHGHGHGHGHISKSDGRCWSIMKLSELSHDDEKF
jgi:hypothetical protein